MWVQDILKDMKEYRRIIAKEYNSVNLINLDVIISNIQESTAYFMGMLDNMLKESIEKEIGINMSIQGCPYDIILLEFNMDSEHKIGWSRGAILISTIDRQKEKSSRYQITGFYYNSVDKKWALPMFMLEYPPKFENGEQKGVLQLFSDDIVNQCFKHHPLSKEEQLSRVRSEVTILRHMAQGMLNIINCVNIITKTVVPPEQLNRKRIKRKHEPYVQYKILEVVKGKSKNKDFGFVDWDYKSPSNLAFHMVGGHFKTYTEEGKLFGKYTGTFWWNPAVRGNRDNGEIIKDYKIRVENGNNDLFQSEPDKK